MKLKPINICIFILLFFPTLSQSQAHFDCSSDWRSDGNYYNFESCMQKCKFENMNQNVTNLNQQIERCCEPQCDSQVSYHTTKRTVIIVFAVVCFVLVFLCCIFGFFGPAIKKAIVMRDEKKKRKVIPNGLSPQGFNDFANDFRKIFTEEERDLWKIEFTVQDQKIPVQWFALQMKKKGDYVYKCNVKGQDSFGVWETEGQFLNTVSGPTFWGLKNYQAQENNPISFDKQSSIVQQLNRNNDGSYYGRWYSRHDGRNGQCTIRPVFSVSGDNEHNFDLVSIKNSSEDNF